MMDVFAAALVLFLIGTVSITLSRYWKAMIEREFTRRGLSPRFGCFLIVAMLEGAAVLSWGTGLLLASVAVWRLM